MIEIDPETLGNRFVTLYRNPFPVWLCDNGVCGFRRTDVIAGIRSSLRKHGMGWIRVENALKTEINDRINATAILMAQGRFQYMGKECSSLENALCTAVWDPKELTKNVRLDDGSSDIDSLDSFEYTFERRISQLIRYG